jgi:1,4-alpha-glucan branching enzyme
VLQIAESWPVEDTIVRSTDQDGAGFDATLNDGLRDALRNAVGQASQGRTAFVDMDRIAREIASPILSDKRRAVQCSENHDIVRTGRGWRIPKIADSTDSHSWYARSRSRVVLGLTLTAVGIPHIFMGQNFWRTNNGATIRMARQDLVGRAGSGQETDGGFPEVHPGIARCAAPAQGFEGDGLNVFHVHNQNRILAFHRWVHEEGYDVMVIASLNDSNQYDYVLVSPPSYWREEFNSDVFDNWVNPNVAGNGGGVVASGGGMHGLPASARITIPANSILVFAR